MKKWPNFRDLFSIKPTYEDPKAALGLGDSEEPSRNEQAARWQKIKFDNAIRAWIAVPTYLATALLWSQHAIPSLFPMTMIFSVYAVAQIVTNWLFMGSKF